MGSSCSSGQAHKEKDSGSTRSEESPSYQVTHRVDSSGGINSGIVLGVSTEARRQSGAPPAPFKPPGHQHCLASLSDTASPGSPAPVEKSPESTPFPPPPVVRPRKIVLYVCAADSQDCKVEKGILHNEVYPELRESCRDLGFELHVVDLHWSLQENNPEPSELCLHELQKQSEKSYLIPIVLLNSTLGAALLPKTIESADFETAASSASSLLRKWYQHDTHAQPPCYRLLPAAHHIPGFKSERLEEREKALEEWRCEVEKILSVMLSAFSNELRDTYLTTVVEQEVHNTVLMSEELAKRCLWMSRVFTHTTLTEEVTTPGEVELKRRLELLQKGLKSQLSESHIVRLQVRHSPGGLDPENPDHCQYFAQVSQVAKKHLMSVVSSIVDEHNSKASVKEAGGVPQWLLEEIWVQNHCAEKNAQCNVNRQTVLSQIQSRSGGGVTVVTGGEGCGKTTLVSRLAQQESSRGQTRVVFRTANLTPYSSTLPALLLSLVSHARLISPNLDLPHCLRYSVGTYGEILPSVLEAAAGDEQLVVILDGIDQVGAQDVDWVPTKLPKCVRIVLTVKDDAVLLGKLKERLKDTNASFIQITDLDKEEGESILLSSVMEYNHSVNSHVQDCVLTSVKQCTLPLYVKVLAWQTSWCSEFDHKLEPRGNLRQQLSALLADLENMYSQKLVEMCLSLLTAAKWGLTDSEMLDLLVSNEEFHTETTYLAWAGACLFWSSLKKRLWALLRWGQLGTAQWRDSSFSDAVRLRYSSRMTWAHAALVSYFSGALCDSDSGIRARKMTQPNRVADGYNRRKLEELPYQSFKSKGTCLEYLTDHEWLFDKICGSSVYQVIEDIELELSVCGGDRREDLVWLKESLEIGSDALSYDGRQMYSVLGERASTGKSKLAQFFAQAVLKPPVPTLVSLNAQGAEEDEVFDSIVRLPNDQRFVVTITTEKEEVSVWDVKKCERVRTLKGVPGPTSLKMIDDFTCVVLCKRELRTYDLNSGTLLTKLKGVMNQKMPYYGLHDSKHLVALSRNRMYVNLMNLETGDLVTTFKAGEDRFLNSLLVSADGRMLVCGDETQKPFPLLVWNLASRKLLYDLRIPGHDFVTSLSAITDQGHYVSCVAREVDDPSPNFIVVYDLQSGTLFKKWKPGVDTVAVDISSRDSCVVSGQSDGSILVWDLVTGNCRRRLSGHSGPVTRLRLDPSASYCLSRDSLSRDPAVRLWDLAGGSALLGVYTPRAGRVSAAELSGRTVVLASAGLRCLRLRTPSESEDDASGGEKVDIYGLPENQGKIFILEER